MNQRSRRTNPREHGFTLFEMLIVVSIVAIMAAVALPGIGRYFRNYNINGAERTVSSTISTARSRAIARNAQAGISFMIVDADSYRFTEESGVGGPPAILGPLYDLPQGVVFAPPIAPNPCTAATGYAFRFNRFGAWCEPGQLNCQSADPPIPDATCPAADATRCTNGPGANYLCTDASGSWVGLHEINTNLRRLIRIEPGGRVRTMAQ